MKQSPSAKPYILSFFGLITLFLINIGYAKAQNFNHNKYQQAVQSYKSANYALAAQQFEQLVAVDSSQLQVYVLLASSHLQLKNWEKAIQFSQIGQCKFPKESIFPWQSAEAHLQLGAFEKALDQYRRVEQINKLPEQVTKTILHQRIGECYSQLGNEAAKNKNWSRAVKHFKRAHNYLRDKPYTYINLAYAHSKVADWTEVRNVAQEGLARFPSNDQLLKLSATASYQLRDYKGAAKIYSKLYEKYPADIDLSIAYGELLMATQDYQNASAHYDQLIRKNPKSKDVYESLIKIYESRLNYQGKIDLLREMLVHFDKTEVYERIAQTYEKMQQWSTAQSYYDTLLSLPGQDNFYIKKQIAGLYLRQDSLQKALLVYNTLLKQEPDNTEVLFSLASCQKKLSLWPEALATYQQINELRPSNEVYAKLGKMSERLNRRQESIQYYRSSLELVASAEAYFGLSKLLVENADSSLVLAKRAFDIAFRQLEDYQEQLNDRLDGNNAINGLIENEELIRQIKEGEELATEIFYHLTSYSHDQVNPIITGLTRQFPKSARIYFLVGEYKFNLDLIDEAKSLFSKAVAYNSNQEKAHFYLGIIYKSENNYRQSILSFERVLSIDNSSVEVYDHLIDLYKEVGMLDNLCDKWMIRYRSIADNQTLKPHLIEALHKAGRYEEAKKIIGEKI